MGALAVPDSRLGPQGPQNVASRVKALEAEATSVASDALGIVMDLTGEVQGVAGAYDYLNIQSKALDILGFTSSLSIFTGPIAINHGWKEVKIARILDDLWAEIKGWFNTVYGVLQTASGAVFAGMSTAMMVFIATTAKTADVVSNILGKVGVGLAGASLLCGTISRLMELPYLFHYGKLIYQGDMEKIREEMGELKLARGWEEFLGEELMEKIKNGGEFSKSELVWPILKEVTSLLLYFTGTVLAALELFAPALFPPWTLGVIGAGLGLLFLLSDGYEFFTGLGTEQMETWERVLMGISGILCLAISITAFSYATDACERIATILAGSILALVHLIVIAKNQKGETNT